jgi:hypothetical protein
MNLQPFVVIASLVISLLLLAVDVGFIALAQSQLIIKKIKDRYLNVLMFSLLILSIIKFLSFLTFIPIIAYLVSKDIDVLNAIKIAATTSFIKIKDERPWIIGVIIAIYFIYLACIVLGNIISSALIERLTVLKLYDVRKYILVVKNIDNISFILFVLFAIITGLISLFELFYERELKMEN